MNKARCDHSMVYTKGRIYVFGGLSHQLGPDGTILDNKVVSLADCEFYNIQ